jgi:hypothetical protein
MQTLPSIAIIVLALGAAACGPTVIDEELDIGVSEDELTHAVVPEKELVIVDPSVIESPLETTFDPDQASGTSKHGAWSFGRLIHNMLPCADRDDPVAASSFVRAWLAHWATDQSPNPEASPADARPALEMALLAPWRTASGCAADDEACTLDMGVAPFRLLAIVNRPDLRIVASDGSAIGGEGRFVFQLVGPTLGRTVVDGPLEVLDATPTPQKLTVIFEYSLPVDDNADTLEWAKGWHALGKHAFGATFNKKLRKLTADFAGPDADPARPNGNALNQLRTNEVVTQGQRRFGAEAPLSPPQIWELREFRIGALSGALEQHTVNLEPARDFDIARPASVATFRPPFGSRASELASFLVQAGDRVLAGKHVFSPAMLGNSALIGGGGFGPWGRLSTTGAHTLSTGDDPPVRVDDAVRDAFAVNTCAGCHRHETATPHFMHLSDRRAIDDVDQTTLGLPPATTPEEERAVIVSLFLQAEIAPPSVALPAGGPRFADFTKLLQTKKKDLCAKPGKRVCG